MALQAARSRVLKQTPRGYGATAARLTPDQKVGSSNLSVLTLPLAVADARTARSLAGQVSRQRAPAPGLVAAVARRCPHIASGRRR